MFFYFKINGQVPLFLFCISISFCGALELVEITQYLHAINHKKQVLFLHPAYFLAEITGVKSYGITDQGEMVSYDPIEKSATVEDGDEKTVLRSPSEKDKNGSTFSENFKKGAQELKNRLSDTLIKKARVYQETKIVDSVFSDLRDPQKSRPASSIPGLNLEHHTGAFYNEEIRLTVV